MSIDYTAKLKEIHEKCIIAENNHKASCEKLSEVADFLRSCKYKELVENPKTGDVFYHILTNDGKEEMVELEYVANCLKNVQDNCREFWKHANEFDNENTNILSALSLSLNSIKGQVRNMSESLK